MFVVRLQPRTHLLDLAVPVGAYADPRAGCASVEQGDSQPDPQPVQLHALPERQPKPEGNADDIVCAVWSGEYGWPGGEGVQAYLRLRSAPVN